MTVPVSYAVEGIVDEAVVLKLFAASGIVSGAPYVCDGVDNLRQRVNGFNAGARHAPWFVLCDLDRHECPAALRGSFLNQPQTRGMEFSVAVRAVEAWLLADRRSFASFLGVDAKRIPREPEQLAHPKATVIELARGSTRRAIREGLVPTTASGRSVGPAYTDQVIRYVQRHWSPTRARAASRSLFRAVAHCATFSRDGAW